MKFNLNCYPEDEIKSVDEVLAYIPSTLRLFSIDVIPLKLKQASISQCIVKSAKPKTSVSPIMLGLRVELDHMLGSKWLIKELAKLGLSVS